MGATYTPICGRVLCGQTRVATWIATEGRSKVVLKPRTFSITITEGPLISLTVNRPKLLLNARSFAKQTDTTKSLGRPKLVLKPRAFLIPPVLVVQLGSPRLVLKPRAFLLGLSSNPAFGRPRLILLGRTHQAGEPGLTPSIPEAIILVPTTPQTGDLVPTAPESGLLVPTTVEVR